MRDPSRADPGATPPAAGGPEPEDATPRWVAAFGVVAVVLVVLFVVLHLAGGGFRGHGS